LQIKHPLKTKYVFRPSMHDFAAIIIFAFIGVGLLIANDDVININVCDVELEKLMVCMKIQVLEVFQILFVFFGLVWKE